MKLGFVIPTYPGEKRVALLPEHIDNFENELIIEKGFGRSMDIDDSDYVAKGCTMLERSEVFEQCNTIFCLKLMQESDYDYLREEQMIIGWTHPTGSGLSFMKKQAIPKNLKIVDLDNIYPNIFYGERKVFIDFIPRNFIRKNSFYAGFAATIHGLTAYGKIPDNNTKVAVLSPGNVSQGAYAAISKFTTNIDLYYRKTMSEFYDKISLYDIIVNGIEVDSTVKSIISRKQLNHLKKGCFVIDAAADAGNAIEGTHYTKLSDPIYKEKGIYFYEVNNAPSVFYRDASFEISKSFSKWVYRPSIKAFYNLLK